MHFTNLLLILLVAVQLDQVNAIGVTMIGHGIMDKLDLMTRNMPKITNMKKAGLDSNEILMNLLDQYRLRK